MRIVPDHKSDMVAIENLDRATDEEIINEIYELLSWLQDINWPVAVPICEKIKDLGVPLVEPIEQILNGHDNVWKYWVITNLISKASIEVKKKLKVKLNSIVSKPTNGEIEEEVNVAATEVLRQCQ